MPKSSKEEVIQSENIVLKELKKNASKSIDAIAKDHNFSRQKVWRIKKQLEDNRTIWGYSAVINEEKRGFNNYIVLIQRNTASLDEQVAERLIQGKIQQILPDNPDVHIESIFMVYGEYDWILSLYAKDIKEVKKFCSSLTLACQGCIEHIRFVETMFAVMKNWILNPEAKKLKELI